MKKYIVIVLLVCGITFLLLGLNFAAQDKDLDKVIADSKSELVKSGRSSEEAGNIVSQAAHQAKAEGLKGKALAERVHEAVRKMQEEKGEATHMHAKQDLEERTEKKKNNMQKGMDAGTGGGMGHKAGHSCGGK